MNNAGFLWCPHCRKPHELSARFCATTNLPIGRKLHRLANAQHPLMGKVVGGRYEVREPIARGGVGLVLDGLDRRLNRRVAIKVIHAPEGPEAVKRLEREAMLSASIEHPNLCVVYDFAFEDGSPYLVLERLEGETLAERVRREQELPVALAVDVVLQTLSALEAAHRKGIVHRDVKPGNVFLVERPSGGFHVKLLDFGYAKDVDANSSYERLTIAGRAVGTMTYMAPEVLQGNTATPSSDLFALAIVLFEALTDVHPFAGATNYETAEAVVAGKHKSLADCASKPLPRGLDAVLERGLAHLPRDRYLDASGMRGAILQVLEGADATLVSRPFESMRWAT